MNRKRRPRVLLLTFAALACGLWAGCATADQPATAEQVKQETTEAIDAAGGYLGAKQDQAQKKFDAQLNAIEIRIDNLKKDSAMTSRKAGDKWRESMEALESEAAELRKRLDAAGSEGNEAWDKLSASIAGGIEKLEKGLDEIGDKIS